MQGCTEAHRSYPGNFSWKLQLMETMEGSTLKISMEVNLLPPNSSIEVN